jgi:endonuclease-3
VAKRPPRGAGPDAAAKAREVLARLADRTPAKGTHGTYPPVDELVFANLTAAYPTWQAVRDAPVAQVEDLIRVCGLAYLKAPRIQRALAAVAERSPAGQEWSLDFLCDMPPEEARSWLTAIDGVGIKTASIVLLFGLGIPALPVDTHVYRVAGRLGLIAPGTSVEKAHHALESIVAPKDYLPFHLALIHHGKTVCRAPHPHCEECPLTDLCDWYAANVAAPAGKG